MQLISAARVDGVASPLIFRNHVTLPQGHFRRNADHTEANKAT